MDVLEIGLECLEQSLQRTKSETKIAVEENERGVSAEGMTTSRVHGDVIFSAYCGKLSGISLLTSVYKE